MPLADPRVLLAATHPRERNAWAQLAVLVGAVVVGAALGLVLLLADRSSWSGARAATATVTGTSPKGVLAQAAGREVVLHVVPAPRRGTRLAVQVAPDGRARPVSFAQTGPKAVRDGVLLVLLLTVLAQAYRFAVTRRGP